MFSKLLPVMALLGALPVAEGGGSGPSVFELRGAVLSSDGASIQFDPLNVAASFCVVIVFTILAELGMHRIEHMDIMHLPVVQELWHMIMKELMILGLISFIIFISVQLFGLSNSDYFLPLEFAHITIFGIAVFLVMQTILHFKLIARSESFYRKSLRMTKDQLEERFSELYLRGGEGEGAGASLLSASTKVAAGGPCCRKVSLICVYMRYVRLWVRWHITDNTREVLEMLMVQANFIQKHHLQQDFDFARVLMHSLRSEVVKLVDIKIRTWMKLVLLIWIVWGVLALIPPCAAEAALCVHNATTAAKNQNETCYVHPPLRCDYPTIAYISFGWTMLLINVAVYIVADIARSRAVVIDTQMAGGAMTPEKLKEHVLMKMVDSTSTDEQIRNVEDLMKQKQHGSQNAAESLSANRATSAAAALSERPALADDATISAAADVHEELEPSSNETILEVQEEGESSSTADSSDSDADNDGSSALALSARRAKQRTKRIKRHARSYSDADFSLPTSFIGGWNLNSVFLVPQKALHGTIETLFVSDCLNKSLFFCYFMAKYVADAGKFIGIETENGEREEVAKDLLEIILIVMPMVLNTILVTPAVTRTFFFISAVSKPSKENLMQTYEDMRQQHVMKVWFLRKLFRARPGDFTSDSFRDWITDQFKSIDHDNDGQLQKRELKKAIRETLGFRIRGHKFAELWRMLDENGSGAVSMDEFVHFVCSVSPSVFLKSSNKSFKIGGVSSIHSSRKRRVFSLEKRRRSARAASDPSSQDSKGAKSPRNLHHVQRSQTVRVVQSTAHI